MRRHLVYAAAGAVVLALGGCGGDEPTPKVADPTAGPSASPSASKSSAAKEPWKARNEAGAIAFAKYWVRLFDKAKSTGETTAVADASADSCVTCQNYIDLTDDIYAHGGSVRSDGWRVLSVSTPDEHRSSVVRVSMRIEQSPQRVIRTSGSEPETYEGGEATFTAQVRWVSGGWTMASLDIIE